MGPLEKGRPSSSIVTKKACLMFVIHSVRCSSSTGEHPRHHSMIAAAMAQETTWIMQKISGIILIGTPIFFLM